MRYRVQVAVGDWVLGMVSVEADSPEDAKEEVRNATIEAIQVWEEEV